MDVNCAGALKSFRRNTFNDIEKFGIGHVITEHIPDNMNHGNHEKAVIGMMSDSEFIFGFENPITEEQILNLNMKSSYSETHDNKQRLATNGDGVKQLFSMADKVFIYNIIENDSNKKIIIEKTIEVGKFFKDLKDDGTNFREIYQSCTSTKKLEMWKKKDKRMSFLQMYEKDFSDFFDKIKRHFNNKLPPFGYIVEFDNDRSDENDITQNMYVLEQEKIINEFKQFLESGCHEIQMKNSVSNYELYYVTNNKEEIVISEIDKFDPTKYNVRRQCLTSYFKFYNNETSSGNIKKYVDFWIKDDEQNRKYTRSITDGYNPKRNQYVEARDKNQINGKLEIYYIDSNKYDEKMDANNRGGWIFLEESNGKNILVNLKAISTDFINKKYGRNGDDFFRSLRIVAHLKDSDYFDTDGRKFLSTFSKYLESLIRHIFEKIYKEGKFYSRNPTNRPWKKGKESSRFNSFRDIENITELLDDCSDNLERAVQGKQAKPSKSSRKKSPKVNKMFGGNKKISPQRVKTDDDVNKVVTQELQTLNKEQNKRHTEVGGWFYCFTHPDWIDENGKPVGKIGICCDIHSNKRTWRTRLKEHQTHYPLKRLRLIRLFYINFGVTSFEKKMLSIYQKYDIQYKTFSTKRSEFIRLNDITLQCDDNNINTNWDKLIIDELPKSTQILDVDLWNNVEISDDEVTPSDHQEE